MLGWSLVIFLYMAMPLTVNPCAAYASPTGSEALDRLGHIAQPRVKIADGIGNRKIFSSCLRIFSYSVMAFCSLPC